MCNTGNGLEYHASGVDPDTSLDTKGMMLVIDDIPQYKLSDSAFWFFTSRMVTYMHPKNKAKTFYQKLLPYLNDKPLKANIQSYDFHMPIPHGRDRRLLHCVMLAVLRGFTEKGLSPVSIRCNDVLLQARLGVLDGSLTLTTNANFCACSRR